MRYLAKLETLERDFEAIEAKMASPSVQETVKNCRIWRKALSPRARGKQVQEYSKIAAEIAGAKSLRAAGSGNGRAGQEEIDLMSRPWKGLSRN